MTPAPILVVVMGVAGSGKSTLGDRLAKRLNVPFCEGDALHPAANIEKMRAGVALDDEDRAPWLQAINTWLRRQKRGGVVSCSALKRSHRDHLRAGLSAPLHLVLLQLPRRALKQRLQARRGHFMPASLLGGQLAILEPPGADEDALALDGCDSPAMLTDRAVRWLTGSS